MSLTVVSYIFKAAIRDKIVLSFSFIMVLCLCLSFFLGGSAVTEKSQFVLVFTAGSMRIAGMLGLVLFVTFFIRRSFETRDVEYMLSRPISRVSFILSHSLAFSLLAIIISAFIGAVVSVSAEEHISVSCLLWFASIVIEYIIMVNVAMFFSMVLSSASASALITVAFYVLARLIGQLLGIVESSIIHGVYEHMGYVFQVISIIVPRIDLMGQTSWLVYGDVDPLWFAKIAVQGLVFTFLVVWASVVDLVRRQF